MKDRLITFALALGALAAFYALLAPKAPPSAERPTRPLSIESGPNGYLALTRWLETERVPTVSLRQRYGGLKEVLEGHARDGNLLITTVPHIYPVRSTETDELRNWIAAGNTLFVAAGLSDTPDWSMGEGADPQLREHVGAMTGLKFVQVGADDEEQNANDAAQGAPEKERDKERRQASLREILAANQKLPTATVTELVPIGSHPLLAGVTELEARSEYPSATWRARSDELDLVLTLAEDSALAEPALWLARFGDGQVVVSSYGSILTNKQLGKRDNARFLANLVQWSVAPNGRVILDDAHQGLVAFYDPQAFYGDARLHKTLWWLLGLWFVFVLGSQRLRQAASSWHPVERHELRAGDRRLSCARTASGDRSATPVREFLR